MQESTCFKNSNGRLGCSSCHDPHSTPAPALAVSCGNQNCRPRLPQHQT
jgi:predicted CXXCH cytochrome family protein